MGIQSIIERGAFMYEKRNPEADDKELT